jgi:tetratricopeptide (TPR) repeat protein
MRGLLFICTLVVMPGLVPAQAKVKPEWQKLPVEEIERMALHTKANGNSGLADSMAVFCIQNYLDKPCDSLLFTKQNLLFTSNFFYLLRSKDLFFKFYYDHSKIADQMIGARNGYSRDVVEFVIKKEEVDPLLYKDNKVVGNNADWSRIYRNINRKYGQKYSDAIVPKAKLDYYRKAGNWEKFSRVFDQQIDLHPPTDSSNYLHGNFGDSWTLNSTAWDVFLACDNKVVLRRALKWVSIGIILCKDTNAVFQYLDTKANILYKLGNNGAAIKCEENVIDLDKGKVNEIYQSTLEKMKNGIPTWPGK